MNPNNEINANDVTVTGPYGVTVRVFTGETPDPSGPSPRVVREAGGTTFFFALPAESELAQHMGPGNDLTPIARETLRRTLNALGIDRPLELDARARETCMYCGAEIEPGDEYAPINGDEPSTGPDIPLHRDCRTQLFDTPGSNLLWRGIEP